LPLSLYFSIISITERGLMIKGLRFYLMYESAADKRKDEGGEE
jgi:hypothetical protein